MVYLSGVSRMLKWNKWHRYPDEQPEGGAKYVIKIDDKDCAKDACNYLVAHWMTVTGLSQLSGIFIGVNFDKLPDSFYWIELPEVPKTIKQIDIV